MKKYIELLFYVSFGAGMAFGTSSFTMMSGLFEITTTVWVVIAICLSGLLCILISTSVAEMASMYPSSPGIRTYLKVAFGNRVSLLLVYLYLIFMVLIAGVESYMFSLVATAIFPNVSSIAVVLGLLAFTITINLLGWELPRGMQIIATFLLIVGILALGIMALVHVPVGTVRLVQDSGNTWQQLALLPAAVIMAVFLFTGFEWVTLLGFSPKSYERRIPLSMPLAILTNVLAYSIFVVAMSFQLPREILAGEPHAPQIPFFRHMLGNYGVYVAGGFSLLAVISTFNAGIMGGSRLIYVLTREGNLPKWCATMSLRTGAPIGGIIVLGSMATVSSLLVVTYHVEILAAVIGSTIVSFVYAAFMWARLRLLKTQPNAKRSFRTPVPAWMQWAIIVIMPIMGILSLFSQVGSMILPVAGLLLFSGMAAILARWSWTRTANQELTRQARENA
ncbi:MAG: APC family permease [Pyrinomonadaceae bacterium]